MEKYGHKEAILDELTIAISAQTDAIFLYDRQSQVHVQYRELCKQSRPLIIGKSCGK